MKRPKIALIGSGNIGGTLAHLALQRNLGDVVLVDIAEGIPQGKSLDLSHACTLDHGTTFIQGGNDYALIHNADVVIVTAGFPRKPGMTREDLLAKNTAVIADIAVQIRSHCPQAFVIVVTNPLDAMVWVMQKVSGLPHNHVVGMAGILDSGRFAYFLADALKVSEKDIQTLVLGGHGDSMVPLPRYTSIRGIPLMEWVHQGRLKQDVLDKIIDRTRQGGAEIVGLLKTGSAFYAPASSALMMAEAYLHDERRILPCAAWVEKAYGVDGLYMGIPVVIGKKGVEEVIELDLTPDEQEAFTTSTKAVGKMIQEVEEFLK